MKKSDYLISTILLVFIFLTLLTACKKSITINLPSQTNKPVLNSLIKNGEAIEVSLTMSKWLADKENYVQLEDAVVELYQNGVFKENLSIASKNGPNRFVGKTIAQKNIIYKVVAKVKGYSALEAEDMVPDVDKIEVAHLSQTQLTSSTDAKFRFDFTLRNKGANVVYYRIRILNNFDSFTKEKLPKPGPLHFFNNKQIQPLDHKNIYDQWLDLGPQIPGSSSSYSFSTTFLPQGPNQLEVSVLSTNTFKYLRSSKRADEIRDDFTSEKGIIFSNVKNGFGIVGGWSTAEFPFK